MLLRCGYLYKFVMFFLFVCLFVLLLFFQKAENNRLKKKPVDQNFVILFFIFA